MTTDNMVPGAHPQSGFEFNLVDALPVPVTNLVNDSRLVKAGDTFLAYPGECLDGRHGCNFAGGTELFAFIDVFRYRLPGEGPVPWIFRRLSRSRE